MSGPLHTFLEAEHRRLDALLRESSAESGIALEPYEAFREGLLRHIGMEEKTLIPAARRLRGGEPLSIARKSDSTMRPSRPCWCRRRLYVTCEALADLQLCGLVTCDQLYCRSKLCACAEARVTDYRAGEAVAVDALVAFCQNGASLCPMGTTVDANGICRYADNACAPQPYLFGSSCAGL